MASEDTHMYRTCALPRRGPSALPVCGATARPSLHTGVSLCHHVTLQRQSHWFHCLLKTPIPPGFQDILQLSVN